MIAVPLVSVSNSARRPISRGGNGEFNAHAAGAMVVHLEHLAFSLAELLDNHADESIRSIDHQLFLGLHQLAINALRHDLRFAHRQLEAFTTHHLNQNR